MSNTETYIVSAKTVDEAMAIAQREYGGAGKDISFDILEMPKKGFLGIGAKDAKIKVTVTEEEEINLGSIVAEMKSYRMQTDRDGGKEEKPKQEKPAQPKAEPRQNKPSQPKADQKQDKPAQPKADQKQDKPAQPKAEPKQDKPAQPKAEQKQDKPAQPKADQKQDKPAQPKAEQKQDKPAQPKAEPKQDKPAQPKAEPKQDKPAQPKAEPKAESKPEKPAFDTSRAAEKPVKKEARATGILDNMPEYKIDENARKTPVYKETGANVKTYSRSPMQTAAVADGSIYSGDTPVADVRWDSARDLKKAEEAAAAAIAAAAPKAVEPIKASEIPVKETVKEAPVKETRRIEEPVEEEYIPSDGSIDVAALDAAIEAMVEDLPAPETRKKTGVTPAEMEHALAFVTTLLANMQIDAKAVALPCPEGEEYEVTEGADIYPAMEIVGEGTGILIGHHGETLDAIQYLLNLAAIRHSDNPAGDYVKISLDIENYRAKREETLRSLARRMAARALKYKRNVFLEPMNAYERRIIHSELQSVENVSTHSVGTDKNRKIIITYEGPDKVRDKAFDDRRRLSDKPENSGNGRRDRKRRGDRPAEKPQEKNADQPEDLPNEPAMDTAEETAAEKPAGEHKSRSRNRNRNRNRNRRRNDGETAPETAEAAVTGGAAAIISGEEREALDRQLSDPANRSEKKPQPKPVEDIPEFLRQPAVEPVEHLREN